MNLDTRTMMVMIALLALMLSGLLALASLHVGQARGMRHWALANFCCGSALILSLFQESPMAESWLIVAGATLLALCFALQYLGIRAFREQPTTLWMPLAVVILVFAQTTWFVLIDQNVNARIIANSLAYSFICVVCAKQLLVSVKPPLKTAYWLTGASYLLLMCVFLFRFGSVVIHPERSYLLYGSAAINPVGFFVGGFAQLCLSFGFVLMINYRLSDELQSLASHDSLTGALTRRSFAVEADRLLARHARTHDPLALLMLDVDHFKQINDQYGHVAGDEVLCNLSAVVHASIRSEDYFARYGGEEFCILLPGITEEAANVLANRLRTNYEQSRVSIGSQSISSTISIGIAIAETTDCQPMLKDMVAAADLAMYAAKKNGRNQVISYTELCNIQGKSQNDS